jgi:hypothetical protein
MSIVSRLLKEALAFMNWYSEKGNAELSNAHHPGQPTTALTELLLQSAEELIWNNGLQTWRLQLSSQYPRELWKHCWFLGIFKSDCSLGYMKPNQLINLCRKMCIQICCSIMRLREEAYCHGLSLGMKHKSITLNHRQKTINKMVSSNLLKEVQGYSFSWNSHGHCSLLSGMNKGWVW